jgi:hypothetical protein
MAINEWWIDNPEERYWMEITDRENLGANLIAPTLAKGDKESFSYTLVSHVQPGDVVFHWWSRAGRVASIVGYSTVSGDSFDSEITWEARGPHSAGMRTTPAYEAPLTDFTELESEITLEDLRAQEARLRMIYEALKLAVDGAVYFPWAFSDKRPLRTTQGYLVKMPASVVALLTGLAVAQKPPVKKKSRKGTKGTGGRQQDPAVRKAIERHAMDWALEYFKSEGYEVDDVGSTESYDIYALNDADEELHIEVKGSSSSSVAVELTDGEVNHWSDEYERVLVVVDEISWKKMADGINTSGGRQRVWRHWELESTDSSLIPIRYRYFVPDGGDNF